ncbi:MAG TPA: rod shape-determining protein MreC, partial [Acetomicrobium hydrogeniformans]|nr:rod shape-determining protein MreC [Acetomicrobium hydrogeniformans]
MRDRKMVEFWQVGISLIAFSMVLMAVVGHQSSFDVRMRSFIYEGLRHLELPALALREGINRA